MDYFDMLVTFSIDFHCGRILKKVKVVITRNSHLNNIDFAFTLVTLFIVFY